LWCASNGDRHEKTFLASGYAETLTKNKGKVGKYIYI